MFNVSRAEVFRKENGKICVQFMCENELVTASLSDDEFDRLVEGLCEFVEFEPEFGGYTNNALSA